MINNSDIDPDLQMPKIVIPCSYITEKQIDNFIDDNSIGILHVNCRSLNANFDSLCNLILKLKYKISIIAVTETWTTKLTENFFTIPGYEFICNSRSGKIGGGVGIYIDCLLSFKLRQDLCITTNIECIFAEISLTSSPNIIIGSIYRPPNYDPREFNVEFANVLDKICTISRDKLMILAGDFNFDLLLSNSNLCTGNFLNMLESHSLVPTISLPTRIVETNSSLLDNIFLNLYCNVASTAIIYSDISDHFPILLKIPTRLNKYMKNKYTRRSFSDDKIEKFNNLLQIEKWENVIDAVDQGAVPGLGYTLFISKFLELFNANFPIRTSMPRNKNVPRNPWITKGLIKSCNKKSDLYKKSKICPTIENKRKYTMYKNKLDALLKKTRKAYYENELRSYNGNLKLTWNLLRNLTNKKGTSSNICNTFNLNETTKVTNPLDIVNHFNDFFATIGSTLANAIPQHPNSSYMNYLRGSYIDSLVLAPCCPLEIVEITHS